MSLPGDGKQCVEMSGVQQNSSSLSVPDPGLLRKLQTYILDSSNWRLSSLLDVKIVCSDGQLYWSSLLLAAISPFLACLLCGEGEDTLLLPQCSLTTVRDLLSKVLQEDEENDMEKMEAEQMKVLRMWAVEERLWKQKEVGRVQIVTRKMKEENREDSEAGVAIVWKEEGKEGGKLEKGGRKMLCKVCSISFQGRPYSEYQEHIQTHRDETGQYYCNHPGCGRLFKAWCHLNDHVYTHGKIAKPHTCSHCSYSSTTKANIRKHEMAIHEDPERRDFSCDQCPKKFKTSSNLMEHVRVHDPEYHHVCEVCNKQFRSLVGFHQHQRTHTGDLFSCNICGEKFQSKHSASRHEKDLHGLYNSIESGQNKVWQCGNTSCRAEFLGEEEYRLHCKTAHQARSSVMLCHLCRKICTNKVTLKCHMKKHHPESGTGRITVKQKGRRDKKMSVSLLKGEVEPSQQTFQNESVLLADRCDCCNKTFELKYQMLSHMAVKHGRLTCLVKACDQAGSEFSSKEVLESHLLLHTGEVKMEHHQSTHSPQEGLECPYCSCAQPSRMVLNMHVRWCRERRGDAVVKDGEDCGPGQEGEDDGDHMVVSQVETEETVELGAEGMVLTLQKQDLLVYQMT